MVEIVPPLRWVGGKRALSHEIMAWLPEKINRYVEPFLGGGTVFLAALSQQRAASYRVNDVNPDLVNLWVHLKENNDHLRETLREFKTSYDALPGMDAKRRRYYEFREEFNADGAGDPRRAALFLALNRTCFNALTRYNGKGHFNTAFGKRERVVVEFQGLKTLGDALRGSDTRFTCGDFEVAAPTWESGDFAYLDPPYHALPGRKVDDRTYNSGGFWDRDERRLRLMCDRIDGAGAKFLLSNHECPEILAAFAGYPYERLACYKSFSGRAASRRDTQEILLGNVDRLGGGACGFAASPPDESPGQEDAEKADGVAVEFQDLLGSAV